MPTYAVRASCCSADQSTGARTPNSGVPACARSVRSARVCPTTGEPPMRRWAEFVLHHRRWVVVFWVAVMVAGGAVAGTTTNRLTIDFSLPGQPGTEAAHKIVGAFHNGGNTT